MFQMSCFRIDPFKVKIREQPPSMFHIMRLSIIGLNSCQPCSGAITVLTSSKTCLLSASEDGTICVWDVISCAIIQRFNLEKGNITCLVMLLFFPL